MKLKKLFKSIPITNSTKISIPLKSKFSITEAIGKLTKEADKYSIPYNNKIIDIKELSESVNDGLGVILRRYMRKFNNSNDYDIENMNISQRLSLRNLAEEFDENLTYARIHQLDEYGYYTKNFLPFELRELVEEHKIKSNQQELLHRAILKSNNIGLQY